MTKHRVVVVFAWAILGIAGTALAQGDPGRAGSNGQPEITPYAFLGSNASGGVGGAVRWPLPAHLSLELESSMRRGGVAAFSTSFSLLFDFPTIGRVTPYAAGGVGLDQYVVADQSSGGPLVVQPRTGVSVNAGGGIRIRGDENWGVRTDARWINGLGQRAPEKWRLYNGVTFRGKGR
jgi:hypothetical protein